MEIIKQTRELGIASYLTQGAELGWFEYGRPGHPKGEVRPPHNNKIKNNSLMTQIIELGIATKLTLGTGESNWECNRPRNGMEEPNHQNKKEK